MACGIHDFNKLTCERCEIYVEFGQSITDDDGVPKGMGHGEDRGEGVFGAVIS